MPAFPPALFTSLAPFITEEPKLSGGIKTISRDGVQAVCRYYAITPCKAMQHCLEHGLWPLRFARNSGIFSADEQSRLLASSVAIIGCGGLGGYVSVFLARAGVGSLILCDGDIFTESNLNRQNLCREDNIGLNKAEVAARELSAIAPHARAKVFPVMLDASNAEQMLAEADLVADCLDSVSARILLASVAEQMCKPLIYGAIAGNEGFVSLMRPGDETMRLVYGENPPADSECAEHQLGVPTMTPVAAATLQAALALQTLAGRDVASKKMYHFDTSAFILESMEL